MAKELPKMYQNKINKEIPNIQKIYTTMYNKKEEKRAVVNDKYTIEKKIYNIFKSPNYIYKIDVIIETADGTFNKRIVGKSKNNLITIDNEYIPIDKIRDIYTK